MTTFSELKGRVLRLLGDPLGEGYSNELITDAIDAAQLAILPWMPKTAKTSLTAGNDVYALPTDFYAVEAVVIQQTGEIVPQAIFAPGNFHGDNISGNNDWIEYPAGSLTFSKELPGDYDLYYLAVWTPLDTDVDDDYVLEPPNASMTGLALYSAAYALQPQAVNTAEVRQFNTRVDSGNPEHNPLQDAALYLLKLFQNEMNRHPKYQRAQR